jgi:signal transduction histidine kinase
MDAVQTRPDGARLVVLEARTAEKENIEITVRDSGPGMPEGGLAEIFNPLFTTKAAGRGVGLALSRMIVGAHGGSVWAENAQTGGAVFRFTLPRAKEGGSLIAERGELGPQGRVRTTLDEPA